MGVWRHFHRGSNFWILTLFGSGYAGLGQEGKQLFAEIRKLGYVGSYASLMRFLAPWREQRGAAGQASRPGAPMHPGAVRHISPRAAVLLMSKPKPKLTGKQREMVEILKRRCPGFATMRHLVLSFRGILCGESSAPGVASWQS